MSAYFTVPVKSKFAVPAIAEGLGRMFLKNFASFTSEPITYKEEIEQPRPTVVKLAMFRKFTCVESCGACCQHVELEYLPTEPRTQFAKEHDVLLNGHHYMIYLDRQEEHTGKWCRYLSTGATGNGRCGIHPLANPDDRVRPPLTCDLPPFRVDHARNKTGWIVSSREFGRARNWVKCIEPATQPKGPGCEFDPQSTSDFNANLIDEDAKQDMIRRLRGIKRWMTYFEVEHSRLDTTIKWAESNPQTDLMLLNY